MYLPVWLDLKKAGGDITLKAFFCMCETKRTIFFQEF